MYRAYKIVVDDGFKAEIEPSGEEIPEFRNLRPKLSEMIKQSSLTAGNLVADSIWDEWFPEVNADVFISHSSKDVDLAKMFAQWLKKNFSLSAFIDSDIWGHSDDLLKEIDNVHCLNPGGETYNYKKKMALLHMCI